MTTNTQHRQARMAVIAHNIKNVCKAGKTVDKEKFISVVGVEEGLCRRTVLEYLESLASAGKIKITGNEITWVK